MKHAFKRRPAPEIVPEPLCGAEGLMVGDASLTCPDCLRILSYFPRPKVQKTGDPREALQAAIDARDEFKRLDPTARWQAERREHHKQAFKDNGGLRGLKFVESGDYWSKKLQVDEALCLRLQTADRDDAERLMKGRAALEEENKDRIFDICRGMEPIPSKTPRMVKAVHSTQFSTQGTGSGTYAANYAELVADEYRWNGIHAYTERFADKARIQKNISTTDVYAMASALDCEIVKNKPMPPVVWLAQCWRRGLNPRVLNPYLPHGLEEKLGVDMQGRLNGKFVEFPGEKWKR